MHVLASSIRRPSASTHSANLLAQGLSLRFNPEPGWRWLIPARRAVAALPLIAGLAAGGLTAAGTRALRGRVGRALPSAPNRRL